MPIELRPQVLPTHTHVLRLAVAGLGCGIIGAGLMVVLGAPVAPLPAPSLAIAETATVSEARPVVVAIEAVPASMRSEISLVFPVGGHSYLKLAALGDEAAAGLEGDVEPVPRHGALTLVEDGFVTSAIAAVSIADLPRAYRPWLGTRVIVDGTCEATVTGFAVVSRLVGDPDYAGVESARWAARSAFETGARVLAATLDGCAGQYARAAALPPVIVPTEVEDAPLVAAARRKLLGSAAARRAQAQWREHDLPGAWHADDGTTYSNLVVRHPTTGATFVSIQARYDEGCGMPEIHVWGLYRVDAGGTLTELPTALDEPASIERLVDIDGDGQLEVIAHGWLGSTIIARTDGELLDSLELPFFGCRC